MKVVVVPLATSLVPLYTYVTDVSMFCTFINYILASNIRVYIISCSVHANIIIKIMYVSNKESYAVIS